MSPEGTVVVAHPETDDLDAAYAEIRPEPYHFTWAGQQWTLPHLRDLDYRTQMRLEATESLDTDELIALFDGMFGTEQATAWAGVMVPHGVLFMLFERWLKHSGAKLGEGEASSSSSGSTGKSSRQTSGASTASASPKPSSAKKTTPRKAGAARPVRGKAAAVKAASAAQQHQVE